MKREAFKFWDLVRLILETLRGIRVQFCFALFCLVDIESFPSIYVIDLLKFMMTSSNGNIFRVTGPLCGTFTRHRWISPHEGQWRGALMFSLICVWINGWVNTREAGDLRRHCANYDGTVMCEITLHQTTIKQRCKINPVHIVLYCIASRCIVSCYIPPHWFGPQSLYWWISIQCSPIHDGIAHNDLNQSYTTELYLSYKMATSMMRHWLLWWHPA